ncbi:MAG TPA: nucleoside/nucleotide kinase family protein [Candidatus Limnocylindrales bacterium]
MSRPEPLVKPSLTSLVDRARTLVVPGTRRILGIAGPPGAGKSTLAEAVCAALGPSTAALVPMDGFHLSNDELVRIGLRDRKGAPETFDADGYVEMLRRVRSSFGERVPVPSFDRDAEAVVHDAIEVPAGVPLVVAEGNYLLLDEGPWSAIRDLLDEAWYLRADAGRVPRLIARHVAFGKPPDAATDWVMRSDEANTARIAPTETRADVVITGLPRL